MKVYAVLFSDCIYESAAYVISLHETREGAVKAMRVFKEQIWSNPYIPNAEMREILAQQWIGYKIYEVKK